jgi:hypothetical protein
VGEWQYVVVIACVVWLLSAVFHTGGKKKETIPSISYQPKISQETSYEREGKGLSSYNSAIYYENQFYDTKNIKYANIAIQNFEEYYSLVPTGEYAVLALLKKVKLYHIIGQSEDAKYELKRLKDRADLDLSEYSKEITYIEDLIK